MRLSDEEVCRAWDADRKKDRKVLCFGFAITIAIFLFSLCWRYNAGYFAEKFVPLEYAKSLFLAFKQLVLQLFQSSELAECSNEIAEMDQIIYLGAIARLKLTLISFVAGGAVALSGAVFQTAYRNPMASPNILGAGVGVRLGNVIAVSLYSAMTLSSANLLKRYAWCYGLTIICVGLIFIIGRLLGGKKQNYSIMDMIMMGSVVTQGLNILNMYLMYEMTEDDMLILQQLQLGAALNLDGKSLGIFFAVMAVSLIPVILLRYKVNAISINREEYSSMGVPAKALSMVCQICAVMMVTCATIHCGDIGMIPVVVPFIVRKIVGSDFRKVCVYSILAGGCLMMTARLICSFIVISGEIVPISFVLSVILTPLFMILAAKRRKERSFGFRNQ